MKKVVLLTLLFSNYNNLFPSENDHHQDQSSPTPEENYFFNTIFNHAQSFEKKQEKTLKLHPQLVLEYKNRDINDDSIQKIGLFYLLQKAGNINIPKSLTPEKIRNKSYSIEDDHPDAETQGNILAALELVVKREVFTIFKKPTSKTDARSHLTTDRKRKI